MLLSFSFAGYGGDIRVRLKKGLRNVDVTCEGLADLTAGGRMILTAPRLHLKNGHWTVTSNGFQRTLAGNLAGTIDVTCRSAKIGDQPLPSRIHLVPNKNAFDLIAILPVEEYLQGVLPNEMPTGWPEEALKAQAVAARSYAYRRIEDRGDREFDVESDIRDQEYRLGEPIPPRVRRVFAQTKNVVLVDAGEKVLEALYHADCGGVTETAAGVWGGSGLATSHLDCPHPVRHWKVELERQSLVTHFINYFGLKSGARLSSVQAVGRDAAGRVKEVRIDFAGEGVRKLSSQEFRKLIGYQRVPSANFQISWQGPNLEVAGLGEGHGVGLCQRGARALAEQGRSFEEILQFYYPGAKLTSVNHLSLDGIRRVAAGD